MVNGSRASAREGAGVAADEGEGAILVLPGEVLGADSADTVKVGEVVNDEIAGFAGSDLAFGFGIENEMTAPVREAMTTVGSGGIGLAGELGHAVFVVKMVVGEREELGELVVKVGLGEVDGGAFVAAGFEKVAPARKRNGAMDFHEVAEG